MYTVSLTIEDMSRNIEGEVVSSVTLIRDLKTITPENLKPVVEILSQLACEKEFMRKGAR